ncbi:MAG: bacteriohopanetetrol glucosamine biosynthesis glycosyltransferase HpnI [Steroidobacteraceae bacterium]|jgi:ceramide glucosyltransferase
MSYLHTLTAIIGFVSLSIAASYAVLTFIAFLVWQLRKPPRTSVQLPPVTLLKPLCGAEAGLYEHLRAFCQQDYPEYQIIFGVRDPADPACSVVERLIEEFPSLPIDVVINPQLHGSNLKVSNLINMLARARHEFLVMADSDAFVGPDYLGIVTAPLLDPAVGLVTCTYRGVPTEGIWSRLGAMYINEWYVPSVLLAWLFGYQRYVSGQSMCMRHDTVRAIGGFRAIANHLADDHRLGELVSELGLRIVLSPYMVEGEHDEQTYESLARHEIRWMRTIRVLRPRSFRMIFLSFSFPLALFGLLLTVVGESWSIAAWALFAITGIIRLAFHFAPRIQGKQPLFADIWLLPVRDLLLCWIWCRSFFTSRVTWRGSEFDVDADGFMRRLT